MKPTPEARAELLHETALLAGRHWYAAWRATLAEEGRDIAGGWPGTLPEARARIAASLMTTLSRKRLAPTTPDELRAATRVTYDEARRAWRTSPQRRPDL